MHFNDLICFLNSNSSCIKSFKFSSISLINDNLLGLCLHLLHHTLQVSAVGLSISLGLLQSIGLQFHVVQL